MHVVCFDIDGTLVASADFDGELYAKAIRDVLGLEVDTDWSRYGNVTDSGILGQILESHVSADQREIARRAVQSSFFELTSRFISENPDSVREVPGALALLHALRQSRNVRVCIATGGWAETAAMKLRAIGLDPAALAIATSSDAVTRTEIMRLAESRAIQGTAARRTYFGDGVWDKNAAAELGYDFVAVGGGVSNSVAFENLLDLEAILEHLGV